MGVYVLIVNRVLSFHALRLRSGQAQSRKCEGILFVLHY